MTVEIRLDLNPTSTSGKDEIRAIANGLLAMIGDKSPIHTTINLTAGAGGGGAPVSVSDVVKQAHQHADNLNAVELANDPADTAPKPQELATPDMNPGTIGFGVPDQLDPAKLGFGAGAATPVVTPAPQIAPPVPAPANIAPPPPPATEPPANTGSVLMDSRNIPWDARIHATNKSKKQDGSWKVKKGVPAEEIARIEGEYKQNGQQAQQTSTGLQEYIQLMSKLGNIIISDANPQGKLTVEQIGEILQRDVGVPNTLALMQRPDLVPYATVAIGNVLGVAL